MAPAAATQSTQNWFKLFLKEGSRREPEGILKLIITVLAVLLSIFEIWLAAFGTINLYQYATTFYPIMLAFAFLYFSSNQNKTGNQPTWLDYSLALVALAIEVYFLLNIEQYLTRIPLFNPLSTIEVAVGVALVLMTLEATRRTLGSTLVWIVLIFMVYTFFGHLLNNVYHHREIKLNHFLDDMIFTTNGLFGTPIGVAATYVFMFVLFGTFFTKSGGGEFFFRLAAVISGRSTGGPAKVAVMSAGMFGMISGSPTSDVLTTGSVNIPNMKRLGYSPVFAGGVEAASATGGSIMPPIMGSAAFLMAEYAGIPYNQIVIAAIIPAVLYYMGIFLQVHFRSKRQHMKPMERNDIPSLLTVLKEGWMHIIPLVFLVAGIMNGLTASYVAALSCAVIIVSSWFVKERRIGLVGIVSVFTEAVKHMIPVTMACAAAGLLIDNIMLTGLAAKFGTLIFSFTFGSVFLTLLATAVLCVIFGMGMPVASAYILTAVLAAPLLINMGVPAMNAHLFIVYYSCLSAITPPVAVAAYAASSIAQADPIKIGLNACKLGIIAFILPFLFVYAPGLLLQTSVSDTVISIVTAFIGVFGIAAAVEGWMYVVLKGLERIVLLAGGMLTIVAGLLPNAIGILLIALIVGVAYARRKKLAVPDVNTTAL